MEKDQNTDSGIQNKEAEEIKSDELNNESQANNSDNSELNKEIKSDELNNESQPNNSDNTN